MTHTLPKTESIYTPTANIIYNLAQLGIPIKDSKYFDIGIYIELIEIHAKTISGEPTTRPATQSDIDAFLL